VEGKTMYMIIDDQRDLNCDIIARTSQAGLAILRWIYEDIEVLVLDHDLGDRSFMDGSSLLKEIIAGDILPGRVQLCTSNPVGRNNMRAQLEDIGYTTINGLDYATNSD
jgi:hypothetical protein